MDIQEFETEQSINLMDYYYVLLKHKWLIITCMIIIVSLTMFFTFQMKPVYKAAATMVIENQQVKSPLTGESLDYGSYVTQTLNFNTHVKLITSRPVLEQVVKDYKLDQLDRDKQQEKLMVSPFKAFLEQIKKNVEILIGKQKNNADAEPQDKMGRLVNILRQKISINEVRDTLLVRINVEDHEPEQARDIANSLAKTYIEFHAASRVKTSKNTLNWMTNQLYETKKKLEDAERDFQAYKQDEKIFSIQGKQNVITQKIQDFNDAYLETRNKRLELDAKMTKFKQIVGTEDILRARSLIDNSLIDNLYAQLLEAEVEFNRLSKVYKSKHPKIVQVQTTIDKTRRKLDEELQKEIENLKAQHSVLYSKEKVLQKTISDFENDALETNKKELQYAILKRNVEANKKLYETLLSKIEETNIDENLDVSNIRIAENAGLPVSPVKPKKKLNLMLSIILGMMTGIGFSFLWEYMDRTLHSEDDVQKYLNLPVLSVIPKAEKP